MSFINLLFFLLYRFIFWPLAILFILIAKRWNPKLQKLYAQRKSMHTPPSFEKPPIWIHASSGEFEYARPVIRKIKERDPSQPVVVTYFSPSYAGAIAKEPGVDWSSPLPLDLPGPVHSFLERLRPRALLIARTDVWPELITHVQRRKIPSLLFSTTVNSRRGLFSIYADKFRRWLYARVSQIFVVSPADQKRLRSLKLNNVSVAGDTRFDQVIYRLEHRRPVKDFSRDERFVFIAGSTWPEDENVLLPAVESFLLSKKLRFIIVPHELDHVAQLVKHFTKINIDFSLYSQITEWNSSVLVVDQVGILAELYMRADFAFVGGSFRKKVHSAMEPLAAGLITIVGPYHLNNREAIEFQSVTTEIGPAVIVVKTQNQLSTTISSIIDQKGDLAKIKWLIRSEVLNRAGASDRVVEWVGKQASDEHHFKT